MTGSSAAAGEDGARARSQNLRQRVVSAVVMAIAVLALTYAGGPAFRLLAAAMAAAVFAEWVGMSRRDGDRVHVIVAALLLGAVLAVMMMGADAVTAAGACLMALAACGLHATVGRFGLGAVAGTAYAALPAICLAFLRGSDMAGLWAVLYLFAVVWASDIAAYFVGRTLGGPKLAPAISPGKTWSGAFGGALGGVAAGGALAHIAGSPAGMLAAGLVAFALSVAAQLGDLFESWLKRRGGVKDSGRVIPGHGGVMDRVDGLVAATIVLYLIGALMAGPDTPAHAFFAP